MTKKIDDKIIALETRIIELENSWKRALADYKNLEKRTTQEKINLIEFSNSVLIENLLPVMDNFVMLEKHSEDQGIKMTVKEFKQVLENAGLTQLPTKIGDDFNHENMDAIETVPGKKNKVVEIIRNGYLYKDKLIRPVSVKVGSGQESTAAEMEK